jgi:O-antigen/teichoic acid export membrane protein
MPLLTYPYLIKILGKEIYGQFIISQVLISYITIFIRFGFNEVSTRFISINRLNKNKIAEVVNCVIIFRIILLFFSGILYYSLLYIYFSQIDNVVLYYFSFFLILEDLFYPKFYFLGLERIKIMTLINLSTRLFSICSIFILIKKPDDLFLIPIINSLGFFINGIFYYYIIYFKDNLKFYFPKISIIFFYVKDASVIVYTNLFTTIKDKLSYFLVVYFLNVSDVVIYDFGLKLMNLIIKPATILSNVLYAKNSNERNIRFINKIIINLFYFLIIITLCLFIILPFITNFIFGAESGIVELRIFLFAPIFLGISSFIGTNVILAFNYKKFMFYSIVFTTSIFILLILVAYFFNFLLNIKIFILITVLTYLSELIFRVYLYKNILKNHFI